MWEGTKILSQRLSISSEADRTGWDAFLEAHKLGQFQQSTRWARAKSVVGWQGLLTQIAGPEGLEGGFLLLTKQTRWGRVGFVNKGPVMREEGGKAVQFALQAVRQVVVQERLRAVVLQPPDLSQISAQDLVACGFSGWSVPGILDASAWASLAGGAQKIHERMNRTTQRECRQALKLGVRVFEGDVANLEIFFDLMRHTCLRQGVRPNPGSLNGLRAIWESFHPCCHLLFARVGAELVAGLLVLRFGKRCTFWKKGWNGQCPQAHPNTLLNYEAMVRAHAWGCEWVDFVGMDRTLAERWTNGEPVQDDLAKTRDAFNLRLGAVPRLLPSARTYLPNRIWRVVTCLLLKLPVSRLVLSRLIH